MHCANRTEVTHTARYHNTTGTYTHRYETVVIRLLSLYPTALAASESRPTAMSRCRLIHMQRVQCSRDDWLLVVRSSRSKPALAAATAAPHVQPATASQSQSDFGPSLIGACRSSSADRPRSTD